MGSAPKLDDFNLEELTSSASQSGGGEDSSVQIGKSVSKDRKSDSLRTTVLGFVAKDKYESAIRELRFYQEVSGDISVFKERTERYFDHCEELILAIKAKKNFPGIDALPMAKRQELFERVEQHFEDLQTTLKRVEQIENDIKVQDARSTIWVLQALIVSGVAVIMWAIAVETFKTMGLTFDIMLEDIAEIFFKLIGI